MAFVAFALVSVGWEPGAALPVPPAASEGVLPGNQNGSLAGAINGVGYYNLTDNPLWQLPADKSTKGFGPGGSSPAFTLPAGWAYGPATVAVRPLYVVKEFPLDDANPTPVSFGGVTDSKDLPTPQYVGDYCGDSAEEDYYTNPAIYANNVNYTMDASVTGMTSPVITADHSYAPAGSWSDLNALGGGSVSAAAYSEPAGAWPYNQKYAMMSVSFTLKFGTKPAIVEDSIYKLDFAMYAPILGVYQLDSAWNVIGFDANDLVHKTEVYLGGAFPGDGLKLATFERQDGWSYFSTTAGMGYMGSDGSVTLRFVFQATLDDTAGETCWCRYIIDYLHATLLYDGNAVPDVVKLNGALPTFAGSSHTVWAFTGRFPAGTSYQLKWVDSLNFYTSINFMVYTVSAERYYNYHADEFGVPAFPDDEIIEGVSLAGTPLDPVALTIAVDRRSAVGTILSVGAFSGYDPGTGHLAFEVGINSPVYDGLVYALAINYTVAIPLAIEYTGGAGSTTITLQYLTAFSLWLREGYFAPANYVVSVSVGGDPAGARSVYHRFLAYVGDNPLYNSTWNETTVQVIKVSAEREVSIAITLDGAAPVITEWHMPPLPYPGAPAVVVQENESMWFDVSYSALSSVPGFDHVSLAWRNLTGIWEMPMEISVGHAYLDVEADQFFVGTYEFYMVVTCGAGNYATTPARNISIIYENASPVIDLLAPANYSAFASAFVIRASVVDVNLINTSIRVEVLEGVFYMGKVGSSFYELSLAHGNWTQWETFFATIPQGSCAFKILADDTRGNHGVSPVVRFVVDRGAPSLVVVTPVNETTYSAPPAIMVTLDDALSNVSLSYSINGMQWEPMVVNYAPPVTVSGTMPNGVFTNITDGPFVLAFLVEDGTAENYAMAVLYLRKDTSRPWINITSITPGALLGKTLPAINFTVMDDSPVACLVQFTLGSQVVSVPVPGEGGTPAGANRTAFSCTIPVLAWAPVSWEGPAILNISAMDSQGLPSYSLLPVLVDTIAPRVTILYPLDGDELVSAPSIRVSGVDGNYLSAWYSLDSGTNRYPIVGLPGTANFACDTTAWANAYAKEVYLLVAIEDTAGNVGVASITIVRADFLEYGPGPNPWIILDIFNQPWPVQVLFWAPVGLFAAYAFVARRRKQVVAPKREVAL